MKLTKVRASQVVLGNGRLDGQLRAKWIGRNYILLRPMVETGVGRGTHLMKISRRSVVLIARVVRERRAKTRD